MRVRSVVQTRVVPSGSFGEPYGRYEASERLSVWGVAGSRQDRPRLPRQSTSRLFRLASLQEPPRRRRVSFIVAYLKAVHAESVERGYRFDATRIALGGTAERIDVPRGQIDFERRHLTRKLEARAPEWLEGQAVYPWRVHPLFRVVPGGVADWERG